MNKMKSEKHEPDFTRRRLIALAAGLSTALPVLAYAAKPTGVTQPARILVLGDSLSAEFGLARGTGWVALLDKRLHDEGIAATVVNASVSGETTSGGLTRLPALLKQHRPTHLLVELGANDALRGLQLSSTKDNLNQIIQLGQTAGAKVLLIGIQVPPNFGKRYSDDFAAIFPAVAKARSCALVPFLLKGVADRPDALNWFQADGIHPLAKAHPQMLDNIWQGLKPLLLGRQR
ncbi:arylesterase [Aquabacterium sp.]|uniref:arylesterase n=1 Tax=Aquabacterium sp. TaxID=1872578 RepID=UPI0035AE5298